MWQRSTLRLRRVRERVTHTQHMYCGSLRRRLRARLCVAAVVVLTLHEFGATAGTMRLGLYFLKAAEATNWSRACCGKPMMKR